MGPLTAPTQSVLSQVRVIGESWASKLRRHPVIAGTAFGATTSLTAFAALGALAHGIVPEAHFPMIFGTCMGAAVGMISGMNRMPDIFDDEGINQACSYFSHLSTAPMLICSLVSFARASHLDVPQSLLSFDAIRMAQTGPINSPP